MFSIMVHRFINKTANNMLRGYYIIAIILVLCLCIHTLHKQLININYFDVHFERGRTFTNRIISLTNTKWFFPRLRYNPTTTFPLPSNAFQIAIIENCYTLHRLLSIVVFRCVLTMWIIFCCYLLNHWLG